MTIIIFFVVLGLLVLVHEMGHFLAAKKAGVYVEEFGFGYPPRAISLGWRWGTLFTLNWVPFGGFVKILGENYDFDSSSQNISESTDIFLLKNSSSSAQSASLASPKHFALKNQNEISQQSFLEKMSGLAKRGDPRTFRKESFAGKTTKLNFSQISKKWQAAILVAGVAFNIIFAWLLFSLAFLIGLPTPANNNFGGEVKNPELTIIEVLPNSPAFDVGLKSGDKIKNISSFYNKLEIFDQENFSDFINNSNGELNLGVDRGGKILDFKILPKEGLVENKKAIGISMDMVGILKLPLHKAFYEGLKTTAEITYLTVFGIFELIFDALKGQADTSSITGPVGIVGLVGDASRLGFVYLITFTSLISINLAVINMVPFPALDGGRLLFVLFEGFTGRAINQKFAQMANTLGFILLISLMVFVTYRDILNLF